VWEVKKLGDVLEISRDGINPSEYPNELFEHYSIPAFDDNQTAPLEPGRAILSNKYSIDGTSVLLSKLNPRIPRVWLPNPNSVRRAITSTEFLVLQPKAGFTREFMYSKLVSSEFAAQFGGLAIGTSTSHQRVKPESLLAMTTVVPSRNTVMAFTKFVTSIHTCRESLRLTTQNLRQTRDRLLPRLLAGQINLPETEP
jgi:type I restriction enzyme S subunit